jgi:hypothetical protein
MKKLMIASAVAAMTAGAFAGNCSEDPVDPDCALVMTVKFSGKTATEKNLEYKTVQKISGKGVLSISDYVTEVLAVKVGKEKYDVLLEDGEVTKLTVFGKNLETAMDENTMKPGKKYKVEADLGVQFEDQTENAISVNQVAFGSASIYVTKPKTIKGGACGEDTEIEGCVPVLSLKKFSGWFTGKFETCLDELGYYDDCVEFDADEVTALIGGTWSAKVVK